MSAEHPWCGFHIEWYAASDVGLRRANNQDSYAAVPAANEEIWRRNGHLYLVADGMGAHVAGELASRIAAETAPHAFVQARELSFADALLESVREANRKIHSRGEANPDFQGMGTTCSVLLLAEEGALVAHVGDSRVYRLRRGFIEQLTFDHSLAWEMRAAARMGDREVGFAVPKNIITRSLGPNEDVQIDLEGPFPIETGDVFLICSDGLSGQFSDAEMGAILYSLPLSEAIQLLVDLANLRGGPDNITVVLAKAVNPDAPAPAADEDLQDSAWRYLADSPWVWGALSCMIAAILLAALQLYPWALALLCGAFFMMWQGSSALTAFFQTRPAIKHPTGSAQFGKGPYVRLDARPNEAVARTFDRLCEQVLETMRSDSRMDLTAQQTQWKFGRQAVDAKNYAAAVAAFGRAITSALRKFRDLGPPPAK